MKRQPHASSTVVGPPGRSPSRTKPTVVKVSGIEARIYRNPVRVRGVTYDSWLVKYPDPTRGRLVARRFSDFDQAKKHAL
ncbi:MAG: hypothetical protein ACKO3N_04170, partial [Verrucomicrobiota bacterium]